jgi:predicted acyl esterase
MQNTAVHTMKDGPESQRYDKAMTYLPLIGMQELLGRHSQFYADWIKHPDYDDYWKALNVEEVFEQIGIPVHTHGGWFDISAAMCLWRRSSRSSLQSTTRQWKA